MVKPNFFIIGAPKCGTTALSGYLAEHPNVRFSVPKEPMFYCSEWPSLQIVNDEDGYLRCFYDGNKSEPVAVGEGSALYLLSDEAIPRILTSYPEAKFIVMVRNPLDMAQSLYAQNMFYCDETAPTFLEAWNLQEKRQSGLEIPLSCRNPVLLQYANICLVGRQIQRAFALIPSHQRHVIILDDLIENPGEVYRRILRFLQLPDDRRSDFSKMNERKTARLAWLNGVLANPPIILRKLTLVLKRTLGVRTLGLHKLIIHANSSKAKQTSLSSEMRKCLLDCFSDDIDLLSQLVERDLRAWKQ